jgi:hypothetical protein
LCANATEGASSKNQNASEGASRKSEKETNEREEKFRLLIT